MYLCQEELYLCRGGGTGGVGVKGLEADGLVEFSPFVEANTDQRVRLLWDNQKL